MICKGESRQTDLLEVAHSPKMPEKHSEDFPIQRPTSDFRHTKSIQVDRMRQKSADFTQGSLLNCQFTNA